MDLTTAYHFINNLPPYPLLNYDALNIEIYQNLDIQKITRYMVSNWRIFITDNKPAIRLHMYSICDTTSATVVDSIINTLYQTLKDCFDLFGTITIEEEILHKYLEINLETLVYKKTNNSYNPYKYV